MKLPDVSNEIRSWIKSQIQAKKQPQNIRASIIGDPCDRYIYHSIMDWEKAKPVDGRLQGIFELGNHLEELGLMFLKKAGYKTRQPDNRYWNERGISGRSDFSISREDIPIQNFPVEVKFLADYGEKYSSWQEMKDSDRRWVRRYPGQLLTYALLHDKELGLFLIFSKDTAVSWDMDHPFHMWFNLDEDRELLDYGEFLLKRCDRTWDCIRKKTPPNRIDPKEGICIDCDFIIPCEPPMWFGDGAMQFKDGVIANLLDKRADLAPFNSDFEKVNRQLKKLLEGVESGVAGDWIIQGNKVEVEGRTQDAYSYWRHSYKRIGGE